MPVAKKPRLDQSESTKHMSVSSGELHKSGRIVALRADPARGAGRGQIDGTGKQVFH
jgi:hypothetical protein